MKFLKRLFLFLSLFLVYMVLKECLILFQAVSALHPYAGYALLGVLLGFIIYYVLIPLVRILALNPFLAPTRNPDEIESQIKKRMRHFGRNPYLRAIPLHPDNYTQDREGYDRLSGELDAPMNRIRKKYVTQVFYSTTVAQNGFLDALLILALSVNMVKEMFLLYHGRVSNRDLWIIARMVYFSMLIGGSEGVEIVVDEIASKWFSSGMKSVPFASKILGSLADGFVNAALVTRISLVTENYCKMVFIESERALYPSYKTVVATTRILTSDLIERLGDELKSVTKDKTGEVMLVMINPVGTLMSRALNRIAENEKLNQRQKEWVLETSQIAHNPFGFLFGKIRDIFQKPKVMSY